MPESRDGTSRIQNDIAANPHGPKISGRGNSELATERGRV